MCERQEAGQGGVLDRLLEEGQEAEQRDVMDGVVEEGQETGQGGVMDGLLEEGQGGVMDGLLEEGQGGVQEMVQDVLEGLVRKVMEEGSVKEGAATSSCVKKRSEELLPCQQCDKAFRGKKRLWAHKQNCHGVTSVCTECGKSFSSRKYLDSHTRVVHNGRCHTCEKCRQVFKSQPALKLHLATCGQHKARRSRRPGIQCHMCPMLLTSSFNLKKHVWSRHCILLRDTTTPQRRRRRTKVTRQPRVWSCTQCASTFKKKHSLHKHKVKHRRQDQIIIQVCGFQDCAFSCQTWADMRSHKEVEHKGKKVFPCDKCNKSFPKFPRLLAHKNRSHSSLLLKCRGEEGNSGCGKEFMRKDVLNQHVKVCGTPMVKPWASLSYSQKRRTPGGGPRRRPPSSRPTSTPWTARRGRRTSLPSSRPTPSTWTAWLPTPSPPRTSLR